MAIRSISEETNGSINGRIFESFKTFWMNHRKKNPDEFFKQVPRRISRTISGIVIRLGIIPDIHPEIAP